VSALRTSPRRSLETWGTRGRQRAARRRSHECCHAACGLPHAAARDGPPLRAADSGRADSSGLSRLARPGGRERSPGPRHRRGDPRRRRWPFPRRTSSQSSSLIRERLEVSLQVRRDKGDLVVREGLEPLDEVAARHARRIVLLGSAMHGPVNARDNSARAPYSPSPGAHRYMKRGPLVASAPRSTGSRFTCTGAPRAAE